MTYISLIAILTLSSLVCLSSSTFLIEKTKVQDLSFKIYSMVFSAKYYKPVEKKTFFFAVPFSFATEMKIDKSNLIHLIFPRADNAKEMLTVIKEEGKLAQKSNFGEILNFSEDFKKIDISLDFITHPNFKVVNVKDYHNQFSNSFQIKIIVSDSKIAKSLYITFDLAKGENSEEAIEKFKEYLIKIKGDNKNTSN